MKKLYLNLDPKTGRFLPVSKGEKPPKMLYMEKVLGIKFEDDYNEKYLHGNIGQKLFARRWEVSKNLIFANNLRGGRRSWVQMLNLAKKSYRKLEQVKEENKGCEICGEKNIALDKAHWKENVEGGSSKSNNILNLCPNCHRRLDRNDIQTIEKGRSVLLFREVKRIFDNKITKDTPQELLSLCEHIILNRKIE